jgi:hypothetical protein
LLAASLTGCSSKPSPGPALARADARPLAALATRIAHEGACAQRRDIRLLQQRTVRLVNTSRVPTELQDPLMSGVNALAEDMPPCVPAVPAQNTNPPPPPPPKHGHGHDHEHGHGHGHDKHKGDG